MPNASDEAVLQTINDLTAACAQLNLNPVLIGGIAVSLVALERNTKDVDALVILDTEKVDKLLEALKSHSFVERFSAMADFGRKARFITMTHQPSGVIVDLALGCMPFEEELLQRSTEYRTGDTVLRLPTPEDLIVLKAIANRPQDHVDIRTIAEVHPKMDRSRIRKWVSQYAELLESPELWSQIEPLLESE